MNKVFLYLTTLLIITSSCCKITITPKEQKVNLIALLNNRPINEETCLGIYSQDNVARNLPLKMKGDAWIQEDFFTDKNFRYIAYAPFSDKIVPLRNGFTLPVTEDEDIIYCPSLIKNTKYYNYYVPFIHGKSRVAITTSSNKDSVYILKSIILKGAVKRATANLEMEGNKVILNWTDKESPKDIELITSNPIQVMRKTKDITKERILLIPGNRKSCLTVTFCAKGQPDEILNIPIDSNLEENKIYKYNIYLRADEISFNPSVEDWIENETIIR